MRTTHLTLAEIQNEIECRVKQSTGVHVSESYPRIIFLFSTKKAERVIRAQSKGFAKMLRGHTTHPIYAHKTWATIEAIPHYMPVGNEWELLLA